MSKELIKWLRRRVTYTDGDTRKEVENRIEELETERDQLREQVKMLRIAMENAWQDGYCFCGAEGLSDAQKQFQRAFAATEQNP